jgi:hypothetical protein
MGSVREKIKGKYWGVFLVGKGKKSKRKKLRD